MHIAKTLTASLVGAVALAGVSVAPAQASDDDLFRFLAGATALAIIVGAANDSHHDRVRVEQQYVYAPPPPRRVVNQYVYAPPPPPRVVNRYVYAPPPPPRVVNQYIYTQPQRVVVNRERTVVINRYDVRNRPQHDRHDGRDWR